MGLLVEDITKEIDIKHFDSWGKACRSMEELDNEVNWAV